jgi:hypothetical protein
MRPRGDVKSWNGESLHIFSLLLLGSPNCGEAPSPHLGRRRAAHSEE